MLQSVGATGEFRPGPTSAHNTLTISPYLIGIFTTVDHSVGSLCTFDKVRAAEVVIREQLQSTGIRTCGPGRLKGAIRKVAVTAGFLDDHQPHSCNVQG